MQDHSSECDVPSLFTIWEIGFGRNHSSRFGRDHDLGDGRLELNCFDIEYAVIKFYKLLYLFSINELFNYPTYSFFPSLLTEHQAIKFHKKSLALDNGDDEEIMVHGKINHVFKVLKFAFFLMLKKYYSTYSSYTIICFVIYTAESFRKLLNLQLYESEKNILGDR